MTASFFFAWSLLFGLLYLAAPESWVIDPFRFRDQTPQELSESIFMFFLPWAAAVLGHLAAGRGKIDIAPNLPSSLMACTTRHARKTGVFSLAVFLTISTYIVSIILVSTDNFGDTGLQERVFIDKGSQYLLLGLGVSAYASLSRQGMLARTIIEALLLLDCFLIASVDMSREALIPAAFALAFYLQHNQYRWKTVFWFCSCLMLLLVVMIRRDFTLTDAIKQQIDVVIVYLVEAIGYITAFNIFHFGQVVADGASTEFSWLYLVLSVVPLPSWMIGAELLESRNFDAYRPYGASADMLSLNPFVLVAYWALFGWVARISSQKKGILRVILAALLFILFVTSFQYSLRTSSKFFILIMIVLVTNSMLRRRRDQGKRHQSSANTTQYAAAKPTSSNLISQGAPKAF